ncbi:MAG TPA: hypothetical protein PKZ53_14515 [Acidobacteriota bacterium]|nr:hypothetical protein [Acidobacteriota bacterium]
MTTPDVQQYAKTFARRIWHDIHTRIGRLRPAWTGMAEQFADYPADARPIDLQVDVQASVPAIISTNSVAGTQRHELPLGLLFLVTFRVASQQLILVAVASDEAIAYAPLVGATTNTDQQTRVPLVAFAPETLSEPQALVQPLLRSLLEVVDVGLAELAGV